MSAWTDFRNKLEDRFTTADSNAAGSGEPSTSSVSGSVFEAIYQYGRGQFDTAVQKATSAFRATSTGKKIEAEATRQKVNELMPYFIMAGIVFVLAIFYGLRRH